MPAELLTKILWSVPVSLGFAILFNTPRRALWVVALLGAAGFGLRSVLASTVMPGQVILASFAGAALVGLAGVYFAHRVHTPPIVFTVPAVINMIPGKYGYEFVIGILKLVSFESKTVSFDFFMQVLNNGLKAGFILMALAFGIIFPILIFNTKTVKDKDLHKMIDRNVVRKMKAMQYRSERRKDLKIKIKARLDSET